MLWSLPIQCTLCACSYIHVQCMYFLGISSISSYDVTGDGSKEILLGRDDGVVEVYSVDETCQPRIQFTHVSYFTDPHGC